MGKGERDEEQDSTDQESSTQNDPEPEPVAGKSQSATSLKGKSAKPKPVRALPPPSVQHHLLRWKVPLSQFQVDTELFRPKPTISSPIMETSTGMFTLDWQLSLAQQRTEAKVELLYKSTDVPNQGVQYTVFAARKDGADRVRLSLLLRKALARPESANSSSSFTSRLVAPFVNRIIHDDATIRLEVVVKLIMARWAPAAVITSMIKEERRSEADYANGTVGARLWAQVRELDEEEPAPEADVTFNCEKGRRVYAHKAVMAAFCPRFAAALGSARKAKWSVACERLKAEALWEALHFVYLRRVSASLHRAPLNHVLEAARLFHQPKLLSLEVEKLLLLLLPANPAPDDLRKLFLLANHYRLHLLNNAALTKARRSPALIQRLKEAKESLGQESPSPAPIPEVPAFVTASPLPLPPPPIPAKK